MLGTIDPGVYVDLEHLIGLEQKGRKVSLLPRQPVHSLLSGRYASRMRGRGLKGSGYPERPDSSSAPSGSWF